ncbi:MAG TPA: hypothetical protein VNF06_03145 [Candidatus Aquilonibacter sp.]|nr:hypothetical protein [Candidatus Aquilonibacter sp.]
MGLWETFEAIFVLATSKSEEDLEDYRPLKKSALTQDKIANLAIFALSRKRKFENKKQKNKQGG